MTHANTKWSRSLKDLAKLYGIHLHYEDVYGERHAASQESVVAVLRSLGVDIDHQTTMTELLDRRRRELYCRGLEPVIVAWDGCRKHVELTLPSGKDSGMVEVRIEVQAGRIKQHHALDSLRRLDGYQFQAERWVTFVVPLPQNLPLGYHRLVIETPAGPLSALLIASPQQAYWPEEYNDPADASNQNGLDYERRWGTFLPLHAIQSSRSWGAGDFTDLKRLATWTIQQGGNVVGTLPLLATFLEEPCDPSPYSPVSRLFWNEFFVDVEAVPELASCPDARALLESKSFREQIATLRNAGFVNYQALAALKRKILQTLADDFFERRTQRFEEFSTFRREDPELEHYACFRAACERYGSAWQQWPTRLREGVIQPSDIDVRNQQYHLYVQWLAHQQLNSVAELASQSDGGLYLDLPLGVRGDAYDAWRFRDTFVRGVHAGAPPDAVWTGGQNWGFPPFHPDQVRLRGYQHLRELLHRQLRIAAYLRIDHVMSLHRLFWIPEGMSPADGVYVKYRPEEMYAVYCLESHLHQTGIIGENLGTVPPEVNRSMRRHGLRHMHVVQYELEADEQQHHALDARCIASLNTHDIPMFAAWWQGDDLPMRHELGLLDDEGYEQERQRREQLRVALVNRLYDAGWLQQRDPDLPTVTSAVEKFLAASPAELMLVNLEDLWGETRPQNIPGTASERPNWKRKSAWSMEQIAGDQSLATLLREVNRLRRQPIE
jgi:4-alpha-glucanotransferase